MRDEQLNSWIIIQFVIEQIRTQMTPHPSAHKYANRVISILIKLQSQLSPTKTRFSSDELHDLKWELREGPGAMGPDPQENIKAIFLIEESD